MVSCMAIVESEIAMSDFTNFRAVYDELTDEVSRSTNAFLPDHLRNWFEQLDNTPRIAEIVQRLQGGLEIGPWLAAALNSGGSFLGSGRLDWGNNKEKAIGMKLLLFREAAARKHDISLLGLHFIHAGRNINDNARAFIEQVFEPMARELRRYLEAEVAKMDAIPASDRVVTINHNSKEYADADAALEQLEKAIREANDFDDPLEKEQREAEVSAARRLLKAARVRVEALAALLKPIVTQYATKLKDSLVGMAVQGTIGALGYLLGKIF